MANRTLYPATGYGSGRVYCEFRYNANSTATPLVTTVDGANVVASFNRTGTGVVVVTLKDAFNKVIYKGADVDDTGDGAYATIGNVTNEGTANGLVFTIRTYAANGTLTDMAVGRVVSVNLALRNGNQGVQ